MREMNSFENELVTKFQLDKCVDILIERKDDEEFVDALQRVASRVQKVMAKYSLESMAETNESVISSARYSDDFGWVYSVRTQRLVD